MKALQLVLIALVVASAVASDVELDMEKPKGKSGKKSTKKPVKVLKPRYFVPRSEVVIVPKGDPRARPPVMIPAPLPVQQPVQPTPFALPTQPTTPAARPILKAGTPTSAACAQRRGTCKASSACTGNFQIVRGICSGPATITCCVPKTAAAKPTTTKPTTTTKPATTQATSAACAQRRGTCKASSACTGNFQIVRGICSGPSTITCCVPKSAGTTTQPNTPASTTTTPASQCPVYASAPESSIKGNGGQMYRVVRIAAQHFSGSADNTMTKATACAFARMAQDAAKAGIRLTINSGFRTYERQLYFWNCFQTKRCNNGNRAARPGNSNHGRGQALDINTGATSTATYRWMAANASKYGFRRTVSDEPWHWER